MLCASAPLPEPGPISCGQVLIVNFVLFESLLAELFRRHGKPPVARRTARGGARSAQGLRACCWFALLLFEIPLHTVAFASAGAGRAAAEDSSGERGGSGQNRKQMCSANMAAKAQESTPAPGRIWTNESEDWPSMRWKQHSKLSKP